MGHSWYKKGDLVRVLYPYGASKDPPPSANPILNLGIVLRRWDAVVYQHDSYDVLLRGKVMTIEHNYLMHVSLDRQLPSRGSGLDPSPSRVIG